MEHKLKSKVIFVHPKEVAFFSGIIIAKIDSTKRRRDIYKGITYMIELRNREIYYVEERFVFTGTEDAKQNIFKALQGVVKK